MRRLVPFLIVLTISTHVFGQDSRPTTAPANASDSYRAAMKQLGMIDANGQRVKNFSISFDQKFLEAHQPARELLLQGSKVLACDWGNRTTEELFDDLSAQRMLLNFLKTDAALWMQKREPGKFVDNGLAMLSLSHHIGHDGPLVSKLVEVLMDAQAIELLAQNLPSIPTERQRTLPQELDAISRSTPGGETMAAEYSRSKQHVAEQGNNFMMLAMVNSMEPFFKEIGKALDEQSPDEFAKTLDSQVGKYQLNPIAQNAIPTMRSLRPQMAAVETRLAMLRTAIDILLHGEGAIARSKDPYGNGPFAYAKSGDGFTLTSAFKLKEAAVSLKVGK